jgi:hypothetical protein
MADFLNDAQKHLELLIQRTKAKHEADKAKAMARQQDAQKSNNDWTIF